MDASQALAPARNNGAAITALLGTGSVIFSGQIRVSLECFQEKCRPFSVRKRDK